MKYVIFLLDSLLNTKQRAAFTLFPPSTVKSSDLQLTCVCLNDDDGFAIQLGTIRTCVLSLSLCPFACCSLSFALSFFLFYSHPLFVSLRLSDSVSLFLSQSLSVFLSLSHCEKQNLNIIRFLLNYSSKFFRVNSP